MADNVQQPSIRKLERMRWINYGGLRQRVRTKLAWPISLGTPRLALPTATAFVRTQRVKMGGARLRMITWANALPNAFSKLPIPRFPEILDGIGVGFGFPTIHVNV